MSNRPFLTDEACRRALSVAERRAPLGAPVDRDKADARLESWRRETGLLDDRRFAERLAHAGLTEHSFRTLLVVEPTDGSRNSEGVRPSWCALLDDAYAEPAPREAMPAGLLDEAPDQALVAPARRLLDHVWCLLLDRLRAYGADPAFARLGSPRSLATLLARPWPLEAFRLINRASVLELHIARFEGSLDGETSSARFDAWERSIRAPAGAARFFARYPVLARDLAVRAQQWLDAGLVMLERLAADTDLVVRSFAGGVPLGPIVDLDAGLSDRHHDGRSVAILSFASGASVVYKPRALDVDRVFAQLVTWLDTRAGDALPRLSLPATVARDGYGWVERVVSSPCADGAALRRYYLRQGAYVALLYALEATDFHHENVIACGEHPMLIDLETLLQPVAGSARMADGDSRPMAFNVLRSGLLPLRLSADPSADGFDLSGLGGLDNPWIAGREPTGVGTDELRYVPCRVPLPEQHNRPRLEDGESVHEIPVWQHTDDVARGFDVMMDLLIRERPALLADDGPLVAFAGLELRFIARATNLYARLLEAMQHPDFQQDGLARDRLLDKLWLDAERFAHFRPLIPHERRALARFDVPRFRCLCNGTDLIMDDGDRLEGYLEESPIARVRRRIATLDEADRVRQRWLLRASIEAIRPIDARFSWQPRPLPRTVEGGWRPDRAMALAGRAGEALTAIAQRISRDAVSWFHLGIDKDESWRLEPVRLDLYNGLPGLALFFAQLASVSGDARFRLVAEQTLGTARLGRTAPDFVWPSIGGMNGLGGWLYCRAFLARLWRDPAQLDGWRGEVARLHALLDEDRGFDIIAGAAGSVAGLLALYEVVGDAAILDTAVACGDHLLAHAESRPEGGVGWPALDGSRRPLTGFAHGTAGCAWVLTRLAAVSGEVRFVDTARAALAYERSTFDHQEAAWPDLRDSRRRDEGEPFFYAWCHGAPGIGLARLACLPLLEDRATLEGEIRTAVDATVTHGFGMNHGLCHGDLGNVELVRLAGEVLGEARWQRLGEVLAAGIVEDIERHGWRTGIGPGIVQPGLLTGLAGIGYGLLRLAAPDRVPSVLMFELPPEAA